MRAALKHLAGHVVGIIFAALLLWMDVRYFLLFLFVYQLYSQFVTYNHLRKMLRVHAASNEWKLLAIMKRLQVSQSEIDEIVEQEKRKVRAEDWDDFLEDFKGFC